MNPLQILRGKLSPDLIPLYEKAVKLMGEQMYDPAERAFLKLREYLPFDEDLARILADIRSDKKKARLSAVAGSVGQELTEEIIEQLSKDLDLGHGLSEDRALHLDVDLAAWKTLSDPLFAQVGLDLSESAGSLGDWSLAFSFYMQWHEIDPVKHQKKLWQLRCLIELERFGEALALGAAHKWNPSELLHVNYLTGLAFEALGIMDQARIRFDAVFRTDPSYRNISQKILNY